MKLQNSEHNFDLIDKTTNSKKDDKSSDMIRFEPKIHSILKHFLKKVLYLFLGQKLEMVFVLHFSLWNVFLSFDVAPNCAEKMMPFLNIHPEYAKTLEEKSKSYKIREKKHLHLELFSKASLWLYLREKNIAFGRQTCQ